MVRISTNPRKIGRPTRWGESFVADNGLPRGLIPVGDTGFYKSPKVVDPRDCDNYPDSIFCGGIPFTTDIANLSADLKFDSCGRALLTVEGSAIFFKFPQFRAAYVPEHCRGGKPPQNPPPSDGDTSIRMDSSNYGHLKNGKNYIVALDSTYNWKRPSKVHKVKCGGVSTGCAVVEYDVLNSTTGNYIQRQDNFPSTSFENSDLQKVWRIYLYEGVFNNKEATPFLGELRSTHPEARPFLVSGRGDLIKRYLSGNCAQYSETADDFFPGNFAFPCPVYGYFFFRRVVGGDKFTTVDVISHSLELSTCREQKSTDPPPYPALEPPCCMACCKPDRRIDELLALLKKIDKSVGDYPTTMEVWDSDETKQGVQKTQRSIASTREGIRLNVELLNRVSRIIGIDLLPFTLPKTTVEKDNDSVLGEIWDFITPDETETITSIMDFFKWTALNDSANWGSWQRTIKEIGDVPRNADGTPQTNEDGTPKPAPEQKTLLPDMASTLEELIRLDIRTQKTLGLILDFVVKLQLETAGIKTTAAQSLLRVEDIQEYLDYPTTEKGSQIPLQVTVPDPTASQEEQNDLHKFEKTSKAWVRYDDWTGDRSLQVQLNQILQLLGYVHASNQRGG